ncbi:MAG: hypothetical protein JWR90_3196 [Marmoricola sp.]|nr:hypothetical protein [Marmoricola sp.]
MRTSIRRTLCATAVAGGFTVLGIAFAASSATADTTSGAAGLLSGNQTATAVQAPVAAAHNQVTLVGNRNQGAGATPTHSTAPSSGTNDQRTTGEGGTASGNQTAVDAVVPVTPSGNQVTVIGDGNRNATSKETASAGASDGANGGTTSGGTTNGADGTGSGNQTGLGVTAPIDVTGNQVTVIGDGNQQNATSGDPAGTQTGTGNAPGDTTSGADGTGSGNQTNPAVTAPVDGSGNQVTVIGDGNTSSSTGGGTTGTPGTDASTTSGQDGTGSGNQTEPVITAPIDGSGNQITIVGDGDTTERTIPGGVSTDQPTDQSNDQSNDQSSDPGAGSIDVSAPTNASDTGSVDAPLAGAASAGSGAQAAPAAAVAGLLPQTGAAADLLLWAILGLAMLILGLGLVTGRRREGMTGRLRGQGVAQTS